MYDVNEISPYVRLALDRPLNYPWEIKERIIYDYELQYIMEGEVLINIEGQEYRGKPGDLFFYRPHQKHFMYALSSTGLRQPHIHFDLMYSFDSKSVPISFKSFEEMTPEEKRFIRADILEGSSLNIPSYTRLRNKEVFEQLLFDVIKEYTNKMPFSEVVLKALFLKLWAHLLQENYWSSDDVTVRYIPAIIKIRDYLNANTGRNIVLDELASKFNISKFHLVRSFKQIFHMPPIHYHQYCRMEKAKVTLQFTNLTLSQIADELGYENISTFSRVFKSQYGLSPSKYRKSVK